MTHLSDVFVGKNNNLTFIRLLAALAVIYGHAYAVVPGFGGDWVLRTTGYAFAGGVAVDLFFLISGFLVTASVLKAGVRHYVVSRVLRVYPALWVHLILVTFVLGPFITTLPLSSYFTHSDVWSYFFGLAGTYKGAFFLPGVFEGNADHAVNGSIWSVLIEVWLYCILLGFYLIGILRSRAIFNVIFFVLLVIVWQDSSHVPSFISGTTNLHVCMMFYIGSFLYINREMVPVSPYYLLLALFLSGMTIGTDRFPYAYALLLVTFFCSASFSSQFAWMDRYGDYSYGVYLYGWPSQQIVALLFPKLSPLPNALISMVLALMLAILSWHLVEKRALRLKNLFSDSGPILNKRVLQFKGWFNGSWHLVEKRALQFKSWFRGA